MMYSMTKHVPVIWFDGFPACVTNFYILLGAVQTRPNFLENHLGSPEMIE